MFRLNLRSVSALWTVAFLFVLTTARAETLDTLSFDKKLQLAKAGDEEAQIAVARAYESGVDIAVDRAEAASWYRKAADEGNSEGMYGLARIVSKGVPGVEKNPELAAKLYEAAARQGYVEAENWLGYSYEHGLGIQQSDANAILWYTKAANNGLAAAQNNLGLMYLAGRGVPRDYGKALALFEQATQNGDGWGANNLGGLYEMGWGVNQDRQKALAYYNQASAKGIRHASENFKRLSAALGSDTTALMQPGAVPSKSKNGEEAKKTPASAASANNDFRPSPPMLITQGASNMEPAPAPRHRKTKAAEARTNTKKQGNWAGGQPPTAKSALKVRGSCRKSFFDDLFGVNPCN